MKDFAFRVGHRPGELAQVAAMLARYGVNIKSLAALAVDGRATVHILPDEPEPARAALTKHGIPFEETAIVSVLLENRAGELARVSRKLGESGVNLQALYVTGLVDNLVELAIVADDPEKARQAIEQPDR
jgi:hypothetical protein